MVKKSQKKRDQPEMVAGPGISPEALWQDNRTWYILGGLIALFLIAGSFSGTPSHRWWGATVPAVGMILVAVLALASFFTDTDEVSPLKITGILAVFSACIYFSLLNGFFNIVGDNCVYTGCAHGLASCKGHVDIFRHPPYRMLQFGFGLPAMMVPFIWMFPENVVALKVPVALSGILGVAATYLLVRELAGKRFGLVVAVLTAFNLSIIQSMDQIMTEIPYYAFSVLALYAVIIYMKDPRPFSWKALFAAAAVAYTHHIKSIAVIMIIALFMVMALQKQWRKMAVMALGFMLFILPMTLRNRALSREYKAQGMELVGYTDAVLSYFKGTRKGSDAANKTKGKSVLENVRTIFGTGMERQALWSANMLVRSNKGGAVTFTVVSVLIGLVLFIYRSFKGDRLLLLPAVYFIGIFMLYLMVGISMAPRYMTVMVPLYYFFMMYGLWSLLGIIFSRSDIARRDQVKTGVFLAVFLFLLLPNLPMIQRSVQYKRTQRGYPGAYQRYYEAVQWIKQNGKTDKPVISRKYEFIYPWTMKLRAKNYPFEEDRQKMLAFLQDYDYILIDNGMGFRTTQQYVIPVINANMDKFRIVHRTRQPYQFVVQTIKPGE